jgi:hypothetical protein
MVLGSLSSPPKGLASFLTLALATLSLACAWQSPGPADESTSNSSTNTSSDVGTEEGGYESGGATESGEPYDPCLGAQPLTDVQLSFSLHRINGEDITTLYDESMGGLACYSFEDPCDIMDADTGCSSPGGDHLRLLFGTAEFGEPRETLVVRVSDGARDYDLATEAGAPASGVPGLISFNYSYQVDGASRAGYGTDNQAAMGIVSVNEVPSDGSSKLAFTAVGGIADWEFNLNFSAALE